MWKKRGKRNEGSLPIQDLQTSGSYGVTLRDFNPICIPYNVTELEQEKVMPAVSKALAIEFLESIPFNEEQEEMINKKTVYQSQSQFWFDQRAGRISIQLPHFTLCATLRGR